MTQESGDNRPLILQGQIALIDFSEPLLEVILEMGLYLAKGIKVADQHQGATPDAAYTANAIFDHRQAAATFAVAVEVAEVAPVPFVAVTMTRSGFPICPVTGV